MPRSRKTRLLIVEDNDDVREVFVEFLTLEGYEVHALTNGQDAIRHLLIDSRRAPDLMIIDLMMPRISGLELLAVRDGSEKLRDIPVIVVSAMPMKGAIPRISSFLMKPVGPEQLETAVREALAAVTPKRAANKKSKSRG